MTCTLHVAWDERLVGYDFGPGHPMAPIRLKLTMELARAFGLGHLDGVVIEVPAAATDAELELIHDQAYVSWCDWPEILSSWPQPDRRNRT